MCLLLKLKNKFYIYFRKSCSNPVLRVFSALGRYHQCIGEILSVHWGYTISALQDVQCMVDIMICVGGYHQCTGGSP